MTIANETLADWNKLDQASAVASILPCCGSARWVRELVETRPIITETELLERSDAIWRALSPDDWDEAFRSHPRIGERKTAVATAQSAEWSRVEQGGIVRSSTEILAALEQGNQLYEQRFGRIYIVCATGKSAEEMLADLQRRLHNEVETELQEAVEQQRQITCLRLRKWLDL
jgi:2-oxo-4-hydroxy-4-carboxy-5-ureidoimidazoline decarboxylase